MVTCRSSRKNAGFKLSEARASLCVKMWSSTYTVLCLLHQQFVSLLQSRVSKLIPAVTPLPGIATGDNTLSSCFGCAMADATPFMRGNVSVIFVGRIDPDGQTKYRGVKERFRELIYVRTLSFFPQPLHYGISIYFRMISRSKRAVCCSLKTVTRPLQQTFICRITAYCS